ncbi:hypothetical protein [Microbacterium sp. zg-YB36]|uniref:hypothetical protein n=1 Tax=Microbacterium sp. zg-YB36 TaxID=2969407 RepID=UPI00214CBDEA|nr:hypothetical protein [Microbacterium sp. zg-YB36]MDL5351114.1 hypothetical protein [Microbacterium sp. zg-YB36]
MTYMQITDPGWNTGVALAYYDAITPFQLVKRFQVHGGLNGFLAWLDTGGVGAPVDEYVVEKFIHDPNADAADLSGVPIEGVIAHLAHIEEVPVIWQTRSDKSGLIGYPESAKTKAQRQRVRFDFLERHGLFVPGTENDDTNDCATHGLVSLKRRKHMPTLNFYFGRRAA